MQPKHFLDVISETYERSYSAFKAGQISSELKAYLLEPAIWAADQTASQNWHNRAERAGSIGAALIRELHGENAAAEAASLSAAIRLHIGDETDPAPRDTFA